MNTVTFKVDFFLYIYLLTAIAFCLKAVDKEMIMPFAYAFKKFGINTSTIHSSDFISSSYSVKSIKKLKPIKGNPANLACTFIWSASADKKAGLRVSGVLQSVISARGTPRGSMDKVVDGTARLGDRMKKGWLDFHQS